MWEFCLSFHWSLFLSFQLIIFQHWLKVWIMAWRRPGDKPLSEPMMVSLLTHICVNRPQWVKTLRFEQSRTICRQYFKVHCLQVKRLCSDSPFSEASSWRPIWQYVYIGSGNGLVPNRRQTNTWTSDDLIPWRHMVLLSWPQCVNSLSEYWMLNVMPYKYPGVCIPRLRWTFNAS